MTLARNLSLNPGIYQCTHGHTVIVLYDGVARFLSGSVRVNSGCEPFMKIIGWEGLCDDNPNPITGVSNTRADGATPSQQKTSAMPTLF